VLSKIQKRPLKRLWSAVGIVLLLPQAGCERRADAKAGMAALEHTFTAHHLSNSSPGEAAAYVNAALIAVRQDDYAGGVMALQSVQQMPQMTADQLKAVHAAMQSLTDTLVERAARGDAKAQAELATIERTRSQ
jgi:hypothetical protein